MILNSVDSGGRESISTSDKYVNMLHEIQAHEWGSGKKKLPASSSTDKTYVVRASGGSGQIVFVRIYTEELSKKLPKISLTVDNNTYNLSNRNDGTTGLDLIAINEDFCVLDSNGVNYFKEIVEIDGLSKYFGLQTFPAKSFSSGSAHFVCTTKYATDIAGFKYNPIYVTGSSEYYKHSIIASRDLFKFTSNFSIDVYENLNNSVVEYLFLVYE